MSILSAEELIGTCSEIGMVEQPFVSLDLDKNLPDFDNGYWFKYTTDDDTTAKLEVLEKEERILQAGIQIIYSKIPSTSNLNEHYKRIVKIAESYYGIGQPTQVGNVKIQNYGNNETVFYISKLNVNNKDTLTFRVGNIGFWG